MPSALPTGEPAPRDGRLPYSAIDEARGARFGIYVHIPFCETRCGYCDFNTYTATELGVGVSQGAYVDTLMHEIRLASRVLGGSMPAVSTVFFGGGTPTLLPAEHLGAVITELRTHFPFAADVEITTEANPESVTAAYFAKLRAAGFTRVSIGMQSAVPRVLTVLDRQHRPGRPEQAVAEARAAGFEHINLDLIYGAPYESDEDWAQSVRAAIAADPDHISAYALVVEKGTALARQVETGVLPAPEDDVLADRYVIADELLSQAGYEWYEVSNWARGGAAPGAAARCRHNELYWTDASWWGFGPGAHSHVGGVRWWNVKHPSRYTAMLFAGDSPAAGRELLDADARYTERVMLGVRLRDGLDIDTLAPHAQGAVDQLVRWGLVDGGPVGAGRLVLSQRGRLLADAVVRELLG